MKTRLFILMLISLMAAGQSSAQTTQPDDAKPVSTNAPGEPYPKIDSQLCATFRVVAPGARKVQVSIGRNYNMEKGEDGVWTVTTKPLGN